VYKVCNFSRRHYVKSFPTVGYWLSLVPVLPAFREVVGRFCCALLPELFGRYSTSGHDEASDRMNATTVLRFVEIAQAEDPMTRLRNLDLGFLPSFLKGANEGDWGESAQAGAGEPSPGTGPTGGTKVIDEARPEIAGPVDEKPDAGPVVRPPEEIRPSAPEILLGNILRSPTIRRDITREVAAEELAIMRREGFGAAGPDRLEELMARVEALETELATLQEPTTSRTRKSPAKPQEE
jgi:hypothetical protein